MYGHESKSLLVYMWNVTPGGPPGIRPSGEYRIQLTGVVSPLLVKQDCQTLLLGWFEELGSFAAFDVLRHATFTTGSPSIQIRQSTLEDGATAGMAFQSRGNDEIVAAFAPDQFMNYVLRQGLLHRFRKPKEVELLKLASKGSEPPAEDTEAVPGVRREVVKTVTEWVRHRDFRIRVLNAYSHRCAVCHLQLELVQAAHIIPVGAPGSSDLTSNGLALCRLHHGAYDDALIGVRGDYHVIANDSKLKDLHERNLAFGEDVVRSLECHTILLPSSKKEWPRPEFLLEGLKIRGWPV
ncbi:MAG: HNH endonuclease [Chloroflexi bacterium]|nr:HNH endonuclease [Chloroflexota bacterium]